MDYWDVGNNITGGLLVVEEHKESDIAVSSVVEVSQAPMVTLRGERNVAVSLSLRKASLHLH